MTVPTWEAVLIGVGVLLLLLWLGPGVKQTLQNTRRGSAQEWMGVLIPIGVVALFVVLLIALA